MTNASWVAGADGFRDGWVVVLHNGESGAVRVRTVADVQALFDLPERPVVIGIDVVIGLPDRAEPGGRTCDREARRLLGHPRSSSVFSPPAYPALAADTYEEAQRLNRDSGPNAPGLSIQTFHLFAKLRAVAEAMTPERQSWVREVHPEVAFAAMNGGASLAESKHTDAGLTRRAGLLAAEGFPEAEEAAAGRAALAASATRDDVLDAHAVCWTARRIAAGEAERLPPARTDAQVPTNARGLRMEIWR
jgi:predicted RNase H-like nuclease